MTAVADPRLTAARRKARLRDEAIVRDKTYQRHPIGKEVARWLAVLEFEDQAENTRLAYETVGAWLADYFQHYRGLQQFADNKAAGIAALREFLDERCRNLSPATRRARVSALKNLFRWAVEDGLIGEDDNPAEKIRPPRRRKGAGQRVAHERDLIVRLVFGQDDMRDRLCLQLLGRLGLRKNELRLLRVNKIHMGSSELEVMGKGGKPRIIPFGALTSLRDELAFYLIAEARQPGEFLLYPKNDRARPMDPSAMHRWFKRCLANAGLPDMVMHELRHSAADHLYRATLDLTAVQMLLGHESVGTTQAYLHPSLDDLSERLAVVEADWQTRIIERAL